MQRALLDVVVALPCERATTLLRRRGETNRPRRAPGQCSFRPWLPESRPAPKSLWEGSVTSSSPTPRVGACTLGASTRADPEVSDEVRPRLRTHENSSALIARGQLQSFRFDQVEDASTSRSDAARAADGWRTRVEAALPPRRPPAVSEPIAVARDAAGVHELTVAQITTMSNSVGVVLLLFTMASHLSAFTIG
jgi:hypothetical protein